MTWIQPSFPDTKDYQPQMGPLVLTEQGFLNDGLFSIIMLTTPDYILWEFLVPRISYN